MNRVLMAWLVSLALWGSAAAADLPAGGLAPSEQQTIARYFTALAQGDVTALKSLLGGGLLRKRLPLLDNPDYPVRLMRHYEGATYEVTRVVRESDRTLSVDLLVRLPSAEFVKKRLHLQRDVNGPETGEPAIVSEFEVTH